MTVRKILVECPVKIEKGTRMYDIPIIQGCNYTLLEDKGATMIIKVTACDDPNLVDKVVTIAQWNDVLSNYASLTQIISHPKDAESKVKYGKLVETQPGKYDKTQFEEA